MSQSLIKPVYLALIILSAIISFLHTFVVDCRGENGSKLRKRKLLEADRKEDMKNVKERLQFHIQVNVIIMFFDIEEEK